MQTQGAIDNGHLKSRTIELAINLKKKIGYMYNKLNVDRMYMAIFTIKFLKIGKISQQNR